MLYNHVIQNVKHSLKSLTQEKTIGRKLFFSGNIQSQSISSYELFIL